jgi:hypothetical protein
VNALCPEFRFGHGGLSRFAFERCHGSSGAVRTVCSACRSSPCTVPGGEGLIDGEPERAGGSADAALPTAADPLLCQSTLSLLKTSSTHSRTLRDSSRSLRSNHHGSCRG